MNLKLSLAQIEQMKRNAKRAKTSEGISHTAALDVQAEMVGYQSWAILMKNHGLMPASAAPVAPAYRFMRSVEEMREALRPRALRGGAISSAAAPQEIVGQLTSMPHVVQHAIEFMNCLLQATNKVVDKSSLAFAEMRIWLPYVTEYVGEGTYLLVNRGYDPVGKLPNGHSQYSEYPHMHAQLSAGQLEALAFRPGESGTAFNDGTQPWASPELARAYAARLERFYAALM
jgi:hypothetical protein